MSTKSRIRRVLDFGRLRDALSGPGADPRTWVCLARVDDDPAALRWETGVGWIVDVTLTSGELAQEGPIPCRVPVGWGGAGNLLSAPALRGSEVLIGFPDGDPNVSPMILGVLHNPTDNAPATTVNGQAIDLTLAEATHILVTPRDVEVQAGAAVRVTATGAAKVLAPSVVLAEDSATQPFVRGTDLRMALDTFAAQIQAAFANLVPPGPPVAPVTGVQAAAALAAITAAVAVFQAQANVYLSTRITGE